MFQQKEWRDAVRVGEFIFRYHAATGARRVVREGSTVPLWSGGPDEEPPSLERLRELHKARGSVQVSAGHVYITCDECGTIRSTPAEALDLATAISEAALVALAYDGETEEL